MKRAAPLKRRTPLRSKPPPRREAKQIDYTPTPRKRATTKAGMQDLVRDVIEGGFYARMHGPAPKVQPWRSERYRRLVAALPCAHCGIGGCSQAAHGDLGKGIGTKTGDDTCYPACGPHQDA